MIRDDQESCLFIVTNYHSIEQEDEANGYRSEEQCWHLRMIFPSLDDDWRNNEAIQSCLVDDQRILNFDVFPT